MPEAATIALLDSFVRNVTGLICFGVVVLRYGVGTKFRDVRARYVALAPAAVEAASGPGPEPTPALGGAA